MKRVVRYWGRGAGKSPVLRRVFRVEGRGSWVQCVVRSWVIFRDDSHFSARTFDRQVREAFLW